MNNSKKIKTFIFKLLFLFIALNLNEIIFSMSSSSRKVIVPAAQSGIRALNSKVVESVESNISVPVTSTKTFKSMELQKVEPQSSQNSYNKSLYAALLAAGSGIIVGSQVAESQGNSDEINRENHDQLDYEIIKIDTNNLSMLLQSCNFAEDDTVLYRLLPAGIRSSCQDISKNLFLNFDNDDLFICVAHDKPFNICGFIHGGQKNYYSTKTIDYEIYGLAVVQEFRDKGIAQDLLTAVENAARQRGASSMYLYILYGDSNKSAIRAYEKFGFIRDKDFISRSGQRNRMIKPIVDNVNSANLDEF